MDTPQPKVHRRPKYNDPRKTLVVKLDMCVHDYLKDTAPVHGMSVFVNDIILAHMNVGATLADIKEGIDDIRKHLFKMTGTEKT